MLGKKKGLKLGKEKNGCYSEGTWKEKKRLASKGVFM